MERYRRRDRPRKADQGLESGVEDQANRKAESGLERPVRGFLAVELGSLPSARFAGLAGNDNKGEIPRPNPYNTPMPLESSFS